MRRLVSLLVSLGVGGCLALYALAQEPMKPPALPTINPGQARLDQTLGGLDGPGVAIAVNEKSGLLVAACERGALPYWQKDVYLGIRAADNTPHILPVHEGVVTALAWAEQGPLASASADGKVLLWDVPGSKPLHTLMVPGGARALALSPDGKIVAAAGDAGSVSLWDTSTGKIRITIAAHQDWVLALAFRPDSQGLASGSIDGTVRLWDVASGKKLADGPAPAQPASGILSLAFSPDGKTLAVGSSDANIPLLNTADGKVLRTLAGHTSAVRALAFHPSGTLLVSGSRDRTVRLWNPTNGQAIKVLEGHQAWVEGVTFLSQGTRLASVGADETIRLWDLKG